MRRFVLVVSFLAVSACNDHGRGGVLSDGGSGAACGGFAGISCAANEFCDFGLNTCGRSDESGVCHPRPDGCTDQFEPVCGCGGMVHGNLCEAQTAGVDVDASGHCPLSSGRFACGFEQCSTGSYCQRGISDIGTEPDTFTCMPLPAGCT